MITAADGLDLIIGYTCTHGSQSAISLIFGITRTPVSDYICFCMHILIVVLQQMDDATIKIPSEEEIRLHKEAVGHCHPLLDGVWCTMDGLKLLVECSGKSTVQIRYYNSWTCDHYIGVVFVFSPDGTIPICCYNVHGSIHDSNISTIGKMYNKLSLVYRDTDGLCIAGLDFSQANHPLIIKSGM